MTRDEVKTTLAFHETPMRKTDCNLLVQDAAARCASKEHEQLRLDDRKLTKQAPAVRRLDATPHEGRIETTAIISCTDEEAVSVMMVLSVL